ncbi:MAG: protein kinase domain-containing protein [Prosthecobacter sp.]|uniref:protein kinase domain-containing protein n=1 Tax=Prosthecobacter sp. TaxID=1965333 RepID=UPI003902489F
MSTSSTASKPSGQWQPPTLEEMQAMLPQYQFESLLGRGGMGAVYKAVQASLDRAVAIKVLPGDLIDDSDAQFAERFKNEARTMAKMNHPAIVNVYDFGETQTGLLYIVMEFIDGTDVSKMISSQGKLPEDYALSITAHVCDALNYAHRHGIIHRDIKPANILINMEGAVKVADFGLAKASDAGQSGLTKTNMAMGTPDFVAPEALIPGIPLDGRADLYAIGVMLYQMLTGEIPRGIWTLPGMKLGTDPRFDAIITKAMQSDRDHRYQSAADLRRDLDTILTLPRAALIAQQQAAAEATARATQAQKQQAPATAGHAATAKKKSSNLGPILGVAASLALIAGLYVMLTGGGSKKSTRYDSAASPSPPKAAPGTPKPIQNKPAAPTTPSAPAVAATPPAPAPEMPAPSSSVPPADLKSGAVQTFGGHRYQLAEGNLQWDAAKAKAESMGGHLATITSKEEGEWLKHSLASLKGTRSHVILGGYRTSGDGPWTWVTGEPFDLSLWLGNVLGTKGMKLAFYLDHAHWDDVPAANSYSFLVEWDDAGTKTMPASTAPVASAAAVMPASPSTPPVAAMGPAADFKSGAVHSFGGHRYQWIEGGLPWDAAKAKAESMGGHLATITSKEESEWLKNSLLLLKGIHSHVSLGGYRAPEGGPWKWVSGEPFDMSLWPGSAPTSTDPRLAFYIDNVAWDDVPADLKAPFLVEWDRAELIAAHPQLARLESGFRSRYETDAQKPFLAAVAALNQSYTANGIAKARAAAQTQGKLQEIIALDAETAAITKGEAIPAEDADATPAALKTLRGTYRTALAKITAERDAKAAPLYEIYLKTIDAYIADLTKAEKPDDARHVNALRAEIASQKPQTAAAPVAAAKPATPVPAATKTTATTGSSWRIAADYLVNNGGFFTAFKNGVNVPVTKPAEIPPGRFDIIDLTFERLGSVLPPAKDADFAAFNGVRDLRRAHFRPMHNGLSAAAFAFLASNSELVFLNFEGANALTDEVLTHIAPLKKLDYLAVQYAENFTGKGLDKIAGAASITNLELNGSGITDEGMKAISTFKKLQALRITSVKVTAAGFAAVANLKPLVSLTLTGTFFDDEAAGLIATVPNLASLDLGNTKITDAGLPKLKTLKKLTTLSLGGTPVTLEAAAEFQKAMPQCRVSR